MGQQMPLPAGWARSLFSSSDPQDRLAELVEDRREAFADIRAVLDRLSAKYHFRPRDVDSAMSQVDDVLGDLFYEEGEAYRDDISERDRRRDD